MLRLITLYKDTSSKYKGNKLKTLRMVITADPAHVMTQLRLGEIEIDDEAKKLLERMYQHHINKTKVNKVQEDTEEEDQDSEEEEGTEDSQLSGGSNPIEISPGVTVQTKHTGEFTPETGVVVTPEEVETILNPLPVEGIQEPVVKPLGVKIPPVEVQAPVVTPEVQLSHLDKHIVEEEENRGLIGLPGNPDFFFNTEEDEK